MKESYKKVLLRIVLIVLIVILAFVGIYCIYGSIENEKKVEDISKMLLSDPNFVSLIYITQVTSASQSMATQIVQNNFIISNDKKFEFFTGISLICFDITIVAISFVVHYLKKR